MNTTPLKKRRFSEGLIDKEAILEGLQPSPGQVILDAGCGNGYMAKEFSKHVGSTGRIYALDTDRGFVDTLKTEVRQTNITPLVGDITRTTDLKESSVDLVYLSTVFHIFSHDRISGFEKEIRRILKPKGRLAVVNIKKEDTPFGPPPEMRSSPGELRQKLSFAPANLIEVGEHFYMQLFENKQ